MFKRILTISALLLLASLANAQTVVIDWALYKIGSPAVVARFATQALCDAGAKALNVTQMYRCDRENTVTKLVGPVVGTVSLAVAGAPNLPLNGTTTAVTVGFTTGVPTKVELSRDGLAPFAIWPTDTFFTKSADGKTLTGSWCISSSCWGGVAGAHSLKVLSTYADATTATATVALNVVDIAPPPVDVCPNIAGTQTTVPSGMVIDASGNCVTGTPPPSSGIGTWQGMTSAMWAEVATRRAAFGDANDCKARVDAIPTTGASVAPGGNIQATVNANRTTMLLGGTHNITAPITVPTGKFLIGAPGATVTINARGSDRGVYLAGGAAVANVIVDGAVTFGVLAFSSAGYTNNNTIYNVSVRHTGFYTTTSSGSIGFYISGGAANNCLVSSDVSNSWNTVGSDGSATSSTAHGGNSDGIDLSYGASNNTLIDFVSFKNGDDGIDMWNGGQMYCYFCATHDNGKVDGKGSLQGDGNGIKLGLGSVAHKFYKSTANNNAVGGFNLNGNTMQPVLVQSTATGNPGGNYINGVNAP